MLLAGIIRESRKTDKYRTTCLDDFPIEFPQPPTHHHNNQTMRIQT